MDSSPASLDEGFSRPLHADAMATGSHAGAVRYLSSDDVQNKLSRLFKLGAATSLDAERAIGSVRKFERSKVLSVGRASRNEILRR